MPRWVSLRLLVVVGSLMVNHALFIPAPCHAATPLVDLYNITGGSGMLLSANGLVIVVTPSAANGTPHSWRWDAVNGLVYLGPYRCVDVSADGSAILGAAFIGSFGIWRESTESWEMVALPATHQLWPPSQLRSISGDGQTVLGNAWSVANVDFGCPAVLPPQNQVAPFRWTQGDFDFLSEYPMAYSTGASTNCETVLGAGASCSGREVFALGPGAFTQDGSYVLADASRDGSRVVGYHPDPVTLLYVGDIFTGGVPSPLTLPAGWSGAAIPRRVSADGKVVLGNTNVAQALPSDGVWVHDFVWTEELGVVTPADYLTSIGADTGGWSDILISDLDAAGKTLVGQGTYLGALRNWYFAADQDGDGIHDTWETVGAGIPMGDGAFYDLAALGASPLRKDIFVEIDAMDGMAPDPSVLAAVEEAFDLAPVPAPVGVPGGLPGIALHLLLDKTDLPVRDYVAGYLGVDDYRQDKNTYFGFTNHPELPAERSSAFWEDIKDAKRMVFHYCIFAYSLPCGYRGLGEQWGNDIRLGLGHLSPPGGTNEEKAGIFMHELGHNLGLYHGGFDYINFKPNYYSVMNYLWTIPRDWCPPGSWKLRYSDEVLPTLCENSLDETVSLGGYDPDVWVPYSVPYATIPFSPFGCSSSYSPPQPSPCPTVSANVAFNRWTRFGSTVDWNGDGVAIQLGVISDVNVPPGGALAPWQQLNGFNDWQNLRYNFRNSSQYGEFSAPLEGIELTGDQEAILDTLRVRGVVAVEPVEPVEPAFYLRVQNPASGAIPIWFGLSTDAPATVSVYDIAGRKVLTREVGGLGPGPHRLVLDEAVHLAPGYYFVRLAQEGRRQTVPVLLVR